MVHFQSEDQNLAEYGDDWKSSWGAESRYLTWKSPSATRPYLAVSTNVGKKNI